MALDDVKPIICPLPRERWREYRDLRLEALVSSPQAFGTTHRSMIEKADEYWQSRLRVEKIGEEPLMLFAEVNQCLVGMIGGCLTSISHGSVIAMFVRERDRGRGIAKMLLVEIIARFQQNAAVEAIELTVNEDQLAAISLYRSSGFREVRSFRNVLGDGNEHNQSLMRLNLN